MSDQSSSAESRRTAPNTTTTLTGHPPTQPPKNTTTCHNLVSILSNPTQALPPNMLIAIRKPTAEAGLFSNTTVFPEKNSGTNTPTQPRNTKPNGTKTGPTTKMDSVMSCATEKLICGSVWTTCTISLTQERTADNFRPAESTSTTGTEKDTGDTTTNSSFNLRAETTNSSRVTSMVSDPTLSVMPLLVWLLMEKTKTKSTPNKTPWPSLQRENGKTAKLVDNGFMTMTNSVLLWA